MVCTADYLLVLHYNMVGHSLSCHHVDRVHGAGNELIVFKKIPSPSALTDPPACLKCACPGRTLIYAPETYVAHYCTPGLYRWRIITCCMVSLGEGIRHACMALDIRSWLLMYVLKGVQ